MHAMRSYLPPLLNLAFLLQPFVLYTPTPDQISWPPPQGLVFEVKQEAERVWYEVGMKSKRARAVERIRKPSRNFEADPGIYVEIPKGSGLLFRRTLLHKSIFAKNPDNLKSLH